MKVLAIFLVIGILLFAFTDIPEAISKFIDDKENKE
jgi:hypothetical protein